MSIKNIINTVAQMSQEERSNGGLKNVKPESKIENINLNGEIAIYKNKETGIKTGRTSSNEIIGGVRSDGAGLYNVKIKESTATMSIININNDITYTLERFQITKEEYNEIIEAEEATSLEEERYTI